jgi:hypothetical protein
MTLHDNGTDTTSYGMAWHGTTRHDVAWRGVAWHGIGKGRAGAGANMFPHFTSCRAKVEMDLKESGDSGEAWPRIIMIVCRREEP